MGNALHPEIDRESRVWSPSRVTDSLDMGVNPRLFTFPIRSQSYCTISRLLSQCPTGYGRNGSAKPCPTLLCRSYHHVSPNLGSAKLSARVNLDSSDERRARASVGRNSSTQGPQPLGAKERRQTKKHEQQESDPAPAAAQPARPPSHARRAEPLPDRHVLRARYARCLRPPQTSSLS